MKKIMLAAVFISALALSARAQDFRFGLTASPVFDWTRVEGSLFEGTGTKVGFQYGLLFDKTIGSIERYAFSSGILINYASSGVSYTDTITDIKSSWNASVQYIEIPLTMRLRTNEVNYITYYGQFGLTPGICIKARGNTVVDNVTILDDVNLRDDANATLATYNLMNISLTLGAGAEYSLSENTSIMGGVFFQNGFANIIKDDVDDNGSTLKQIGIRLGVLF